MTQKLPWEIIREIVSYLKPFDLWMVDKWERKAAWSLPYLDSFRNKLWTDSDIKAISDIDSMHRCLASLRGVSRTMYRLALDREFETLSLSVLVSPHGPPSDNVMVRIDTSHARFAEWGCWSLIKNVNIMFVPVPEEFQGKLGSSIKTVKLRDMLALLTFTKTVRLRQANIDHLQAEAQMNVLQGFAVGTIFDELVIFQTPMHDPVGFARLWTFAQSAPNIKRIEIKGSGLKCLRDGFDQPVKPRDRLPLLPPVFSLDEYIAPVVPAKQVHSEANDELTLWLLSNSQDSLQKLCWLWQADYKPVSMPAFANLTKLELHMAFPAEPLARAFKTIITGDLSHMPLPQLALDWLQTLPSLRHLKLSTRESPPPSLWTKWFLLGLPNWIKHLEVADLIIDKSDVHRHDAMIVLAERQLESITLHCPLDLKLFLRRYAELSGHECKIQTRVVYVDVSCQDL